MTGPSVRRGRARPSAEATPIARIRALVAKIPRGYVTTYGALATAAGFPRAPRLAVRALQNAEGLPWHRVVALNGRIVLPGDAGHEQRLRLEIEGVTFAGGKVRMDRHRWRPGRRGPGAAGRR